MVSSYQKSNGCGSCRFAGNSTERLSIAPALTEQQYRARKEAGAHYYCVALNRPVWVDDGKNCSSWVADS